MKIVWKIHKSDVAKVRRFFAGYRDHANVQKRVTRLNSKKEPISKALFWERMVGCLLTTRNRSGPGSPVALFLERRPFPLGYDRCVGRRNVAKLTATTLQQFRGIRRFNIIGGQVAANLSYLENGGWHETLLRINKLRIAGGVEFEQEAAEFIDEHLRGFGPKQSRNLLQWLGLSRYEVPIDSRVTKWLNEFGFPVKLAAPVLQDRSYYNFVSLGFQRLCEASEILPCVLDAAIFASFDESP